MEISSQLRAQNLQLIGYDDLVWYIRFSGTQSAVFPDPKHRFLRIPYIDKRR